MDLKTLKKFIDIEDKRLSTNSAGADHARRALARTVKLSEEVGELAEAVLGSLGLQRKAKLAKQTQENLEGEFADVIITTFLISKTLKIDVPAAIGRKIKKIN